MFVNLSYPVKTTQTLHKQKLGRPPVSEETKKQVEEHLNDDGESWQAPGLKDFVIVKSGEKKINSKTLSFVHS